MPNGVEYNREWCDERHTKLDTRLDKVEARLWVILVTLFVNLGGIAAILFQD